MRTLFVNGNAAPEWSGAGSSDG